MPVTDLVTPDYLRTTLLAGVIPLVARSGAVVTDEALWAAIDDAVSKLEHEFGLALRQTRYVVREDRTRVTHFSEETYQMQTMLARPLQSIEKLSIKLGNMEWYTLPRSWVYIASKPQAVVQIVPISLDEGQTTIATYRASFYSLFMLHGYIPGVYSVEYTAGFEKVLPGASTVVDEAAQVTVSGLTVGDDLRQYMRAGDSVNLGGVMHRVKNVAVGSYTLTSPHDGGYTGEAVAYAYDPNILQYIAYSAAVPILATLGATVYGYGVVGQSIRIDGLAQTKNLNPRGPFANLIEEYKAKTNSIYEALHAHYAPVNMAVI
jgi:hypothetical protein